MKAKRTDIALEIQNEPDNKLFRDLQASLQRKLIL